MYLARCGHFQLKNLLIYYEHPFWVLRCGTRQLFSHLNTQTFFILYFFVFVLIVLSNFNQKKIISTKMLQVQ